MTWDALGSGPVVRQQPVFHIMKFLLKLWAMIDFDLYHLHAFTPLKLQMGAGCQIPLSESTVGKYRNMMPPT